MQRLAEVPLTREYEYIVANLLMLPEASAFLPMGPTATERLPPLQGEAM